MCINIDIFSDILILLERGVDSALMFSNGISNGVILFGHFGLIVVIILEFDGDSRTPKYKLLYFFDMARGGGEMEVGALVVYLEKGVMGSYLELNWLNLLKRGW